MKRPSSGRCRNTGPVPAAGGAAAECRLSHAQAADLMISPLPCGQPGQAVPRRQRMRQFVFVLASSNLYGEDVLTNISNSGFSSVWRTGCACRQNAAPCRSCRQPHGAEARSHIHRVPVQRNSN